MGNLIELTNTQEVKFEAFSLEGELLTASVGADGKKMIHGVASSTTKDLHGDTILLSALEDMERSAVGLTVFRNHKYDVPDDVGGTITRALIKQKGVDEKGDPNYQLEVDIEVEEDNAAALQTWKFIQKGRKLGLSIGAMIPENGAKRQKDGTFLIEHVLLLELSMVGIPANPKSWIDYAASALRGMVEKSKTTQLGNPTLTIDGKSYRIEGSMEGLELNLGTDPEITVEHFFAWDRDNKVQITRSVSKKLSEDEFEGSLEPLGSWDLADPDDKLMAIAAAGEDVIEKATVWVETRDGDKITIGEPEVSDSVTADVDPDATAATPDPDVTDAKVRIIEVDTDDKSDDGQGASSSEPDDTLSAPEADVTATVEPVILEGLSFAELSQFSHEQLRNAALQTTARLVETTRLLDEEKLARASAEKQRDAVIEAAGTLVQRTVEVIEKIANTPLPRKASLKAAGASYIATIEGYYGEDMARVLAGMKE